MSVKEVAALLATAQEAGLEGADWAARKPLAEIVAAYNGIGADWMPAEVRAKITEWLALFEPAALIHDLRYTESDGYRLWFNYANDEFLRNCRRLAANRYAWYNWRRYRANAVAAILYECVRSEGGWRAWQDAAKKRGTNDAKSPQNFHDNSADYKLPTNKITAQI